MKISILHLEDGLHQFQETINRGSLHFYRDEIYPDDIQVNVDLNKFGKNITCSVEISTRAHYICDRCLAEYQKNYIESFSLLFHTGNDRLITDEANVVILSPDQKEIDLLPFIQETLILTIPMKQLCRISCKGICPGCGADLNHEKCTCAEKPVDPRWEKLIALRK
ncbi:MAG: DUF177 domain-containing protein [Calditrichaeota bacterium]|nr:DUF177 domain-containing protein [Calditrichota bacterium]RQW06597.1 MAG: DUF177 domain-containing protein [Calditrichota bacterium]